MNVVLNIFFLSREIFRPNNVFSLKKSLKVEGSSIISSFFYFYSSFLKRNARFFFKSENYPSLSQQQQYYSLWTDFMILNITKSLIGKVY